MTMTAVLDTEPNETAEDISSNRGWFLFSEWASATEGFEELEHLAEYGWSGRLLLLKAQIAEALKKGSPDENIQMVGNDLVELLSSKGNAEVLVITNDIE